MKIKIIAMGIIASLFFAACQTAPQKEEKAEQTEGKAVVYQVFTRLFGNKNTTNKPWGTIEENGVGKFNDFSDKALTELKDMGITHMWYTGVPHHALIRDYTENSITDDDPDVVKGRAGSPYAVKDYYSVNPDLAIDVDSRLEEFEALIERTHQHEMKVIIDIVPNHVARHYNSPNNPNMAEDFGASDDTSVEYEQDNNFYYILGKRFEVPNDENVTIPLGGEKHPLADGKFEENPAKWTGNGSREAKPMAWDWYETVKINYGVKPDGTHDFASLPDGYDKKNYTQHLDFWGKQEIPNSWYKFRDIALFWTDLGVDGFRFDMAEMVPVEFWSFMNSSIKMENPDAFLLAEVYNPALYRDYIHLGKMDYLYDKVALYDTLKHIMQGHGSTNNINAIQEGLADIEHNMLHFLENHDEQRIASKDFAGSAEKGKPAMVVSTCISTAPTMIYFGQEVGEPGDGNAGFGTESRTTIFDYWGVPNHQRWMNNGAFDGGQLSQAEKDLRSFYKTLLRFSSKSSALMGKYAEIQTANIEGENYDDKLFSFVRYSDKQKLIIVSNFSEESKNIDLQIPANIINTWKLKDNTKVSDVLSNKTFNINIKKNVGSVNLEIEALGSYILEVN